MQVTPAGLDAVYFNLNTAYNAAFARVEPWTPRVATQMPSSTRENRYAWMEQIPRLREWVGERVLNNLTARVQSIINKDWELTIKVDRNDIDDDQLGVYTGLAEQIGHQAKKWPDDVMVQVLQSGTTTLAFDGQNFFDSSHPYNMDVPSLGTYANNFATTPLTPTNLQAVRAAMMSVLAADGKPLRVMPDLLIVPPQLEAKARQILNAEIIAPVAAFGVNAAGAFQSNIMSQLGMQLLVLPDLANQPDTWYVLDTSKPLKPFVFQLRKAPQFVQLTNPTDANLFFHKEYIYGVDSRGNGGFALPFLAARAKET